MQREKQFMTSNEMRHIGYAGDDERILSYDVTARINELYVWPE
jgi:hypothetical protein